MAGLCPLKIEQYPSAKEVIESFYAMSWDIAALEGATANSLLPALFAIIEKVKTYQTKFQCFFLKIISTPNIYKNREGLIFDLFMSHNDLSPSWKREVCREVLDGTISTHHIVEIYSNFYDAKYRGINLSQKQLREKAQLQCEKEFLFMTVNDNRFDGALKIYYTIGTKHFMHSLPRYAVRWYGILENKIRETILKYGIHAKKNTDATPASHYILGALDLLSEQYKVLPSQQVEAVLHNAVRSSHVETKKRAYQVGAEIFGWSYYEKGLKDPSSKVRKWIERVLATGEGYEFQRGRPRKKRDTNQLKLF